MMLSAEQAIVNQNVGTSTTTFLRLSTEATFLLIGGIFGLLFLLTTPPFQVADESRHFVRAYQLSEQLLADVNLITPQNALPKSLVSALVQTERLRSESAPKITVEETLALMTTALRPDERANYSDASTYTFVSYLPQIVAISLLRLAEVNAIVTFYIARFVALLFWLFATYWALKLIPIAKPLFFFLALLPMTVFQAGSLSADCVTFSLSFLLIAFFLRLAYQRNHINAKDLWIATGLSVALTAAKFVYAPLIGLYFLIPISKFRSPFAYVGSFLLISSLSLLTLFIVVHSLVPTSLQTIVVADPSGLTPYPQLNFLLASPLNVLRTAIETVGRFGRSYLDGFIGVLGWYGASLPAYLYIVSAIMLCLTCFTLNDVHTVTWARKLLLLCIIALITIGICIAICTDIRENPAPTFQMRGIQGRYFTPFAFLIGLLISGRASALQPYHRFIILSRIPFILFLHVNAYVCLLLRYYF